MCLNYIVIKFFKKQRSVPQKGEIKMRKKTLAVLLAGAVAAAGIIGLTACKKDDGIGIQKGDQVTEEQWKAAITATVAAENYTVKTSSENNSTASGKVGEETVNYSGVSTSSGTLYYDLTNKKVLTESTSTEKVTGGKLFDEEDGEETLTRKMYIESEGLKLWSASFDDEKNEWGAYSNTCSTEVELKGRFSRYGVAYMFSRKYSATQGGAAVTVSELYSAFAYDDGYYSATLYDEYGDASKITASVKGGHVIGLLVESTNEGTETDGTTYKDTYKTIYNLSNFGSTTVTAPAEAAAAIAAAKTPAPAN